LGTLAPVAHRDREDIAVRKPGRVDPIADQDSVCRCSTIA